MSLDLFARISRTYRCQFKHLCAYVLDRLSPKGFYKHPVFFSFLWYGSQKGCFPRLKHPRDFNEQLIAINLNAIHDSNQRLIRIICADKFAVRDYIHNLGLDTILNDCYGVYGNFKDIDFSTLPNQFVLKLTNGCGQNYICKDKSIISFEELESICNDWIINSSTFGLKSAEWHYSAIQPRIIAEKYLSILGESTSIIDYKFHCINGKVIGVLVCYDRDPLTHEANFDYYDTEWNLTDGILPQYHKSQRRIPRPKSFDQMKGIAELISKRIEYVRVDLYEIDGKPVFGEMTFTPAGNIMTKYQPWVMDYMLTCYNETKESKSF